MNLYEIVMAGDEKALREAAASGVDLDGSFDESDECPLTIAASKGDAVTVGFLLELGADPNNTNSVTPPILAAVQSGSEETVQTLLEAGVDVNTCDEDGATPLMEAAAVGHLQIVEVLLAHNANPKSKDRRGNTALSIAASKNHVPVCDLLSPLATPKERKKSQIALNIHAQGGVDERIDALILSATKGKEKEVMDLVSSGTPPDAMNAQGKTALMRAANKNRRRLVEWLLEQGADVNRIDLYGECPLSYAAMGCHPEMYDFLYELTDKKLRKRAEKIKQNQIDIGNWPSES